MRTTFVRNCCFDDPVDRKCFKVIAYFLICSSSQAIDGNHIKNEELIILKDGFKDDIMMIKKMPRFHLVCVLSFLSSTFVMKFIMI